MSDQSRDIIERYHRVTAEWGEVCNDILIELSTTTPENLLKVKSLRKAQKDHPELCAAQMEATIDLDTLNVELKEKELDILERQHQVYAKAYSQ